MQEESVGALAFCLPSPLRMGWRYLDAHNHPIKGILPLYLVNTELPGEGPSCAGPCVRGHTARTCSSTTTSCPGVPSRAAAVVDVLASLRVDSTALPAGVKCPHPLLPSSPVRERTHLEARWPSVTGCSALPPPHPLTLRHSIVTAAAANPDCKCSRCGVGEHILAGTFCLVPSSTAQQLELWCGTCQSRLTNPTDHTLAACHQQMDEWDEQHPCERCGAVTPAHFRASTHGRLWFCSAACQEAELQERYPRCAQCGQATGRAAGRLTNQGLCRMRQAVFYYFCAAACRAQWEKAHPIVRGK